MVCGVRPGPGFPNRLSAELAGGLPNGIDNLNATFVSPHVVRLDFDVAPDASLDPRDILLTNPDGQTAIVLQGLSITASSSAAAISSEPHGQMLNSGLTAVMRVTATGVPGPSFHWRKDGGLLTDGGRLAGAETPEITIVDLEHGDVGVSS